MKHYLIKITYDGLKYDGWQRIPNNNNTIQLILENSISKLLKENIKLRGSGRTDAGVSALSQFADFFCSSTINSDLFIEEINNKLDDSIRVISIIDVPKNFHSRTSCISKTYRYNISLSTKADVFRYRYLYNPIELSIQSRIINQITDNKGIIHLNLSDMKKACKMLSGRMDYSSFTTDKSDKSHIRCIKSIDVLIDNTDNIMTLEFTGDGFLYNMVRILSGTLLYVGLGLISINELEGIIKSRKRKLAGPTLPANALILYNVCYDMLD